MSALRVQMWAAVLAAAALLADFTGAGLLSGGPAVSAAVLLAALLLALRTVAGLPLPATGRAAPGVRLRGRTRQIRVSRLSDPDAAGRPRPRAPGRHPLAN